MKWAPLEFFGDILFKFLNVWHHIFKFKSVFSIYNTLDAYINFNSHSIANWVPLSPLYSGVCICYLPQDLET